MSLSLPLNKGFKDMLAEANADIETISVHAALKLLEEPGVLFVDVREAHEFAAGMIPGSLHAPRGYLEFLADPECSMHRDELAAASKIILFCATGGRSTLAAKTLMDMGYSEVYNLVGGLAAWRAARGPLAAA